MSNAVRDNNRIKTITTIQDTSSSTIINVKASDSTHRMSVTFQGTDGTGNDGMAKRDENFLPVMLAASSVDGVTPVALYATSDGKLLI